jgi:hypothetical protein
MFTYEEAKIAWLYERGMGPQDIMDITGYSFFYITSFVNRYLTLNDEQLDIISNQILDLFESVYYNTYST